MKRQNSKTNLGSIMTPSLSTQVFFILFLSLIAIIAVKTLDNHYRMMDKVEQESSVRF